MTVYALGSDGANGTNVGIFTSEADLYRALADDICSPAELDKARALIDAGNIEGAKEFLIDEVSPPEFYTFSIDEKDVTSVQNSAAITVLRAMREELEAMSGYWTERMSTLAQAADEVLTPPPASSNALPASTRPELPEESQEVEVRIRLDVWDFEQFREAARKRALEDGLDEEEAAEYLDEEEKSIGECAMMLLDPGVGPAGSDVEESSCIE
jgi:hypothetical protein